MNDKSPNQSMLKKLEAKIKKIESNAIDQAMKEFVPKGYKKENIRSLFNFKKKAKGGIVKKRYGGSVTKKTKKKK
jgi:hypothetical protein